MCACSYYFAYAALLVAIILCCLAIFAVSSAPSVCVARDRGMIMGWECPKRDIKTLFYPNILKIIATYLRDINVSK